MMLEETKAHKNVQNGSFPRNGDFFRLNLLMWISYVSYTCEKIDFKQKVFDIISSFSRPISMEFETNLFRSHANKRSKIFPLGCSLKGVPNAEYTYYGAS